MSDMQCNSSSCIAILAMAIHVIRPLIIANTWSSNITGLNVLSDRWDEVFLGEIIHLDCRSPDRLVRKGLHNSSCATDGVLSAFTQLIIVTLHCLLFGDIDFQVRIYNTLWRPIMSLHLREALLCSSSCHGPSGKDRWRYLTKKTVWCLLSVFKNKQKKTPHVSSRLLFKSSEIMYNIIA